MHFVCTYVCVCVKELVLNFRFTDESSGSKTVLQNLFAFSILIENYRNHKTPVNL